jgi:transcriptional regulator with XRE-family HTH domain
MNTAPNNVEAIRKAQGKSRQQLANAARTSPQYIQKLETEIRDPGIDMSRRVAEALGVPLDEAFPPAVEPAGRGR